MSKLALTRYVLQAVATVFLLTAIVLTFVAMFTSSWQVAQISSTEIYKHGLFKDCELNQGSVSNVQTTGDWLCFWKYEHDSSKLGRPQYEWKPFQKTVFALLASSIAFGFLAIIFANVTCIQKYCSIPWAIHSLIAALLSLSGMALYARWSHEKENRFFKPNGGKDTEQEYGSSVQIASAGLALYIMATILGFVGICVVFVEAKRNNGHGSSTKKSHLLVGTKV